MKATDRATVAVRIERDLHHEAVLIAQLQGITLTELIIQGITEQVAKAKADPKIVAKAADLLIEADAEHEARRRLLAALGSADA